MRYPEPYARPDYNKEQKVWGNLLRTLVVVSNILFWFLNIIQPVTSLPAVIDYSLEVYPWLWVDIR